MRTTLTITGGQWRWLDSKTDELGVGKDFIADRAVTLYRAKGWPDENLIEAADEHFAGYLRGKLSKSFTVEFSDTNHKWLKEKSGEQHVTMGELFRRSLDLYRTDVVDGSKYRDPKLEAARK